MTVGLVSLGCAKNAADLEVRVGRMLSEGWTLSSTPDYCDTLVVNTCAFIESARKEAEREIRRALALKRIHNYTFYLWISLYILCNIFH